MFFFIFSLLVIIGVEGLWHECHSLGEKKLPSGSGLMGMDSGLVLADLRSMLLCSAGPMEWYYHAVPLDKACCSGRNMVPQHSAMPPVCFGSVP